MSGFILAAYGTFFTVLMSLGLYLWIDRRKTLARLKTYAGAEDQS